MIDVTAETLIALADVPALLPRRRGGKKPHVSCIYRWTTAGVRGVLLESVQVGGTRCTSKEALARFFHRLSSTRSESVESPAAHTRRTEKAKKDAERFCEQMGI